MSISSIYYFCFRATFEQFSLLALILLYKGISVNHSSRMLIFHLSHATLCSVGGNWIWRSRRIFWNTVLHWNMVRERKIRDNTKAALFQKGCCFFAYWRTKPFPVKGSGFCWFNHRKVRGMHARQASSMSATDADGFNHRKVRGMHDVDES